MDFLIATHNMKKRDELQRILSPLGVHVLTADEAGVDLTDVEETGTTFEENALLKARSGCKEGKMPCIADDSGLCVDALDGAPGVYSARFAGEHGNDDKNNEKLLSLLSDVPPEKRTARFVSTVACVFPDGRELVVRGECEGKIGYESENMRHCRESVDAITNCILKNGRCKIAYEKLTAELAARDGELLRLCEQNKIRNPDRYLYAKTFQRDLYRRMGNIVIKEILKKRRDELLKAREIRHAKARQKVYRESLTDCILTSMEIAARADTEAAECFREFREKLELAETERLLEQMEM